MWGQGGFTTKRRPPQHTTACPEAVAVAARRSRPVCSRPVCSRPGGAERGRGGHGGHGHGHGHCTAPRKAPGLRLELWNFGGWSFGGWIGRELAHGDAQILCAMCHGRGQGVKTRARAGHSKAIKNQGRYAACQSAPPPTVFTWRVPPKCVSLDCLSLSVSGSYTTFLVFGTSPL